MTEKMSLFFEWVKLVQRAVMVILTLAVLYAMFNVGTEIDEMNHELRLVRILSEKTVIVAEEKADLFLAEMVNFRKCIEKNWIYKLFN